MTIKSSKNISFSLVFGAEDGEDCEKLIDSNAELYSGENRKIAIINS